MKEMLKNTFILLVITVLAGGVLGLVYDNTKDVIAKQEEETKKAAYKDVFSNAADFNVCELLIDDSQRRAFDDAGYAAEDITELIEAKDAAGNVIGYVFTIVTHEGYGGDISFTMGVSKEGKLNGITILSISETAGLGMEAEKVLKPQFEGRDAVAFRYSKTGATEPDEIDAISGATITTNAVTNGVNLGLYYFNEYLGGADHE